MSSSGPSNQNLSYQYHDGVAGGSDSLRKLAAIRLPKLAGLRFLDLGCNAGFFCGFAIENGAGRVVGVETSKKVAELARARHPNAEIFDAGWDVFPDGLFDVVICLSAIHYAEDVKGLLDAVHRHLSEDGLLVLEGGLVDENIYSVTDLPVPCWREVGDRVRHMSTRFLKNHALVNFDWEVVGSSIQQGGDPIERHVIHARKRTVSERKTASFTLCPAEFARAAAASAPTIQSNQRSYDYVKALGAGPLSKRRIGDILAESVARDAFVDDICYVLRGQGDVVEVAASLGEAFAEAIVDRLRVRGIRASMVTQGELATRPIHQSSGNAESVERAGAQERFLDILPHCELSGARVASLSTAGLVDRLVACGVAECHAIEDGQGTSNSRVTKHNVRPWHLPVGDLDYLFFDATAQSDFDHVDDLLRVVEALPRMLGSNGFAYAVLRTGVAQADWDIYNSVLLTPIGRLPSSDYLYNNILRNFAVRPLFRLPEQAGSSYCVTRVFRIAPKQPSLLIVAAASQGGKTTVSRSLKRGAFHISNDYVFHELFRFRTQGALPGCSQRILAAIDGGKAEDVGRFFRAIESDEGLFSDYLALIQFLIPSREMEVSLDLDVRQQKRLDQAKKFFSDAGFSVWAVTR